MKKMIALCVLVVSLGMVACSANARPGPRPHPHHHRPHHRRPHRRRPHRRVVVRMYGRPMWRPQPIWYYPGPQFFISARIR